MNGGVRVQFVSTGTQPVELRTVNGGIHVALPATAKATVKATWVNGGINLMGLPFEIQEQAKRRFEGRLNGGGPSVEMATVNGGITIGSELDRSRSLKGWDEPPPELPADLHERR